MNIVVELNDLLPEKDKIIETMSNEINTENVDPLTIFSSSVLPKRDDVSNDINSSEEILKNAPEKIEGFFSVPKVVE